MIAGDSTFQFKDRAGDVRQVAARDLGAHYVLEGTRSPLRPTRRITAQLINANLGVQHWAERYDRELKDVFAVQDEVARAIASVLVAHVNKAEAARSLNQPPRDVGGLRLLPQGNRPFFIVSRLHGC